jgi:mannose-1-phosphate guanylyltransferase/phosphomannomutase
MEHVVRLLRKHDISEMTALLYFQPEQIKEHFKDGSAFGVKMDYCLPEDDYGTAGAVRAAIQDSSEPIIVISGDLITDFDLNEAIAWHRKRKAEATILLTRVENPLPYGIVITEEDGRIIRFLEKPSWGEAFSDTINTGIYILEPGAINLIPPRKNHDFSQNLFPLMLSRGMRLFGRITEGYWRDVGNVAEYLQAHSDLFAGEFNLDISGEARDKSNSRLFLGSNVNMEDDVTISGTVLLGDDVQVRSGAVLHNCAIGSRSQIGPGVQLKNSIVWYDTWIGADTAMDSSIVCRNARLGNSVRLLDNVIVSDNCHIGDGATVKANCKIWPDKTVDASAIVSASMVWGEKWNRELFTDSKVTGLAISELSPEMAVRLGAAFGATLGRNTTVVTSRDGSDISRLIRRGLISGILTVGVNVADLEAMPVPVVRYALSKGQYSAGVYVRHNPHDYRQIDIILFDGNGLDMPTVRLKKVERNYFGEDFERASLDDIGHLDYPQRVIDDYRHEFLSQIDVDRIQTAGFKLVADHSNGASCQIFPILPSILGVSITELNANLNPRKFSTSQEDYAQSIVQLSAIVTSLGADVGFLLNTAAEKLTVVDETGQPFDPQLLLLAVTDLFLSTHKTRRIAVPVEASMGVEQIAAEHGVEVIRVANDHRALMEARMKEGVEFVGGTRGGFIFPGFQMGADAMVASVKLLEMMAQSRVRFSELRHKYEHYRRRSLSVPCPWTKKGTVMRCLITGSDDKERQLIDGVRIFEDDGWVLVAPDRTRAAFTILAEATSKDSASTLVDRYRLLVEEWQQN